MYSIQLNIIWNLYSIQLNIIWNMFSIYLIKYFNKTLIRIQFTNNLIIVIKHEVIQNFN